MAMLIGVVEYSRQAEPHGHSVKCPYKRVWGGFLIVAANNPAGWTAAGFDQGGLLRREADIGSCVGWFIGRLTPLLGCVVCSVGLVAPFPLSATEGMRSLYARLIGWFSPASCGRQVP